MKWICVWCNKEKGETHQCCAPDGDGHLFKKTENKQRREIIMDKLMIILKELKESEEFAEMQKNLRWDASPDMLEALMVLADWPLRSTCYDGSIAKNANESICNARRFARDAILKATNK